MQVPSAALSPSVLGTLTLDGAGHYTLSGLHKQGTYSVDASTNQITFTGVLAAWPVRYSAQTFIFIYGGAEGSGNHTCYSL
jgi:hypothetical protein